MDFLPPVQFRIHAECWLLFHGDGFGQVAGLVYVAAAADGYVVGEELEGARWLEVRRRVGGDPDKRSAQDSCGGLAE
jgi:hypothetical protein